MYEPYTLSLPVALRFIEAPVLYITPTVSVNLHAFKTTSVGRRFYSVRVFCVGLVIWAVCGVCLCRYVHSYFFAIHAREVDAVSARPDRHTCPPFCYFLKKVIKTKPYLIEFFKKIKC